MNEIRTFENSEFGKIRTLEINGEPYFIGRDVTEILGYSNSRKALSDHVDEEDKGVTKCDTLGGTQTMTVINESGLYSLVLSSKLPSAKVFKRWVTSEVLPAIRKHGTYGESDYSNLSPQLQFLIQLEKRQNRLERRIDSMCETMQVRGSNWRKATHSLINRIASASGIEQRELYIVIYDELECRAGVDLDRRLTNLQDRLYDRGVSESRISRLNYIDVIAEDRKLIEIYIAIVKETAIKYNAE